jgi:hypothetical protein
MMDILVWTLVGTLAILVAILVALCAVVGAVRSSEQAIVSGLMQLQIAEQEQTAQFKAARETRELTREGRDLLRARLVERVKQAKQRAEQPPAA